VVYVRPMEVGDLVRWKSLLWFVHKIDATTGTAILESEQHTTESLGAVDGEAEALGAEILCNPTRDWPFVTLTNRPGRLVSVHNGSQPLAWLVDWVKVDPFQMGGALFVNSTLGLGFRDRLTLTNNGGRSFPVNIPRGFLSSSQRRPSRGPQQSTTAQPAPKIGNLYSHLLTDDDT
jgi:hypothetical protein